MKKSLFAGTVGLVALGIGFGGLCLVTGKCQAKTETAAPVTATIKGAKEVLWLTSLDAAQKASKSSGKPIFVDFYATWCPPCKMLEAETYPDPKVIAESQKWIMVKIDTDKQIDVATRYGISGLPTLAVLKADGKPVLASSGFVSADDLVQFMHEAKAKAQS